ncbi:response regulator [Kaistia algarum]|uniref:response regulator n=1 Tax=Kaistia algarum TaxID=2083279 RepID=UPI000CE87D21|nr:response regulator [Kaistia algarum]MCX5514283.1 response regulator [Kaistia algarum]PPE79040.1 response regulator [Kaistia algarum]
MARILVTEDDDSVRSFVARALTLDGHRIVTAEDGADALETLRREEGAFDLLLSDIRMPMMDGIALAKEAAPEFPDLTILLMTGYADQRERAEGLDRIVHDVVQKPFSLAEIRHAVQVALRAAIAACEPASPAAAFAQ